MENNYIGETLKRLPPGFRFQPTEEEIVFDYLRCKTLSLPLPASIIPNIHLSLLDPSDLPGDIDEERYFFTKTEAKHGNNYRKTSSGRWKATGSEKHLPPPQNQALVMTGIKKTFVFYRGKSLNLRRTDWFMHEYSLCLNDSILGSQHMTRSIRQHNSKGKESIQEWMICCVFLKQRLEKDNDASTIEYTNDNQNPNPNMSYSCYSSSSSSNSVTRISSNGLEFEDITSPN